MSESEAVLDFWFGPPPVTRRAEWFGKAPEFDAAIRDRFGALIDRAGAGGCDDWQSSVRGTLALVITLDQFPRNVFRGQAKAFAFDPKALATARRAVARGDDRAMRLYERVFLYLPFEHAEELGAQRESLRLFGALPEAPEVTDLRDYARRHYEIVARFGRFPHRNAILGRASTAEETRFLAEPNSSF